MNMYEQVTKNDVRLKDLAYYHESKGLTVIPKTQEELAKLQEATWNRFAEFKMRVIKSKVPIDDIERMVLEKFGIYDSSTEPKRDSKFGFGDL